MLFNISQSSTKKPNMSKECTRYHLRHAVLQVSLGQEAGEASFSLTLTLFLLNSTFALAERLTIHFAFKMFFFRAMVLCVCRLATLIITFLFKQISLSHREGSEE